MLSIKTHEIYIYIENHVLLSPACLLVVFNDHSPSSHFTPIRFRRKQETWQTSCRSAWSETLESWLRCPPRTGAMFGSSSFQGNGCRTSQKNIIDPTQISGNSSWYLGWKTLMDNAFLRSQDWLSLTNTDTHAWVFGDTLSCEGSFVWKSRVSPHKSGV